MNGSDMEDTSVKNTDTEAPDPDCDNVYIDQNVLNFIHSFYNLAKYFSGHATPFPKHFPLKSVTK